MARATSQSASSAVSDTSDTSDVLCAWCIREDGETPEEGDSHGICEPHAEQELITYYTNKFNAVPSYVERFKDGREAW
jgi:hypothetical protein